MCWHTVFKRTLPHKHQWVLSGLLQLPPSPTILFEGYSITLRANISIISQAWSRCVSVLSTVETLQPSLTNMIDLLHHSNKPSPSQPSLSSPAVPIEVYSITLRANISIISQAWSRCVSVLSTVETLQPSLTNMIDLLHHSNKPSPSQPSLSSPAVPIEVYSITLRANISIISQVWSRCVSILSAVESCFTNISGS